MINSILISPDTSALNIIKENLYKYCRDLLLIGNARSVEEAHTLIAEKSPKLVFIDTHISKKSAFDFLKMLPTIPFEIIFISENNQNAAEAFNFNASGYLLKPINIKNLIRSVQRARQFINLQMENKINQKLLSNLKVESKLEPKLTIPTMNGLEFVPIKKIIRCEGLQRCTKLIIQGEKNLVSSHNIGVFAKSLLSHGFYTTHRSHLINLQFIKRYDREGNIMMIDESKVPLSRRRKQGFLNKVGEIG